MSDQNNVADTFGGGAHRRVPATLMPAHPRPVPTFQDERDAAVMAESDKVVEQLKTVMDRQVGSINKPGQQPISSPLKEIAQRIKKLVHDDGEQMGDELKAKITDSISLAKALQLWADDTLREKTSVAGQESQRGA